MSHGPPWRPPKHASLHQTTTVEFYRDEQVGTEHVLLGLVWEEIDSAAADRTLKEGVWSAAEMSAARLGASYDGLGLHPKAVRDANAWVRADDVSAIN